MSATPLTTLTLYRHILKAAKHFPSVKKSSIIREIKHEFRANKARGGEGFQTRLLWGCGASKPLTRSGSQQLAPRITTHQTHRAWRTRPRCSSACASRTAGCPTSRRTRRRRAPITPASASKARRIEIDRAQAAWSRTPRELESDLRARARARARERERERERESIFSRRAPHARALATRRCKSDAATQRLGRQWIFQHTQFCVIIEHKERTGLGVVAKWGERRQALQKSVSQVPPLVTIKFRRFAAASFHHVIVMCVCVCD